MKRSKPYKKIREIFQKIHLWVGLTICVPIVIMGLTGSVLVFQDNIDSVFFPAYELEKGVPRQPEEIINAAYSVVPDGLKATMYIASSHENKPAIVRFSPALRNGAGATPVNVIIDSASLKILAVEHPDSKFLRQIYLLHSAFLIKEYGGRNIVGWIGVAMVLMGISGLIIWWPKKGKWKKALTIKPGARGLRLHRDLHSVVGVWGFVVFLTISFTGVYLAFPQVVGSALSSISGSRNIRSNSAKIKALPIEGQQKINADNAISIAEQYMSDSKLLSIMLPSKSEQPYRVNLSYPGFEQKSPAIAVFIDPWSGKVLEVQDPRTYSLTEKFTVWARTIHEGRGFGWIWRMLVFIAGFFPLLFSITGVSMWLIKRK